MPDAEHADTTNDTTLRETGHDARSDANERGVQKAADQAEARAGILLPEQAPKDSGHMPNGDKAGPQAGQEHAAEKPAPASGFEALDKRAESLQPNDPPPRVMPYSQPVPDHHDSLLGKTRDYLEDKQTGNDPRPAQKGEDVAPNPPPRPQVGRDHQAVLDYMAQYVDWRIALAFQGKAAG